MDVSATLAYRMYSSEVLVNISHVPSNAWMTICIDKDKIPRYSSGPSAWRGIVSGIREYYLLTTYGITVPNGALATYGTNPLAAMEKTLPYAHMSHPAISRLMRSQGAGILSVGRIRPRRACHGPSKSSTASYPRVFHIDEQSIE